MSSKTSNTTNRIIAIVALLLMIGAINYSLVEIGKNTRLEDDLKTEKLAAENLLSEKLLLEKEISKLKTELQSLEGRNSELDNDIQALHQKLSRAEQEIKNAQSQKKSVSQLKTQNQELVRQKEELEEKIASLKKTLKELQSSNDDLMQTVVLLQEQNKKLNNELLISRFASLNEGLVESTKRNGRLTVNARKTKKLTVMVDVPVEANNLAFNIVNPDASQVSAESSNIQVKVIPAEKKSHAFYTANNTVSGINFKRVEMTYAPEKKLKAGLYKINVLNESMSIGTLQVRLR